MKIIVGLGNPGTKYEKNRHNAGFMFVDKLAGGNKFSFDKKFEVEMQERDGYLLVKPQTFMNESGRAVRKILDYYKLDLSELTLVHDDLDLETGEYKIQTGIGPKVHNGVNSVEQYLGTEEFLRVRIGVDNRKNTPTSLNGADYVLEDFGKEERAEVLRVIDEAARALLVALGL